jgi:hypothetical protein
MDHFPRLARLLAACALVLTAACARTGASPPNSGAHAAAALLQVADAELPQPLSFIAYGDMRFTAASETEASVPAVRRALVARIAADAPAAVFLSGDVPWHGGTIQDYAVYREETRLWREKGLRVYPALGNHEFALCAEAQCLENWWSTFPELRGHRWYAVALGSQLRAYALDSDTSLLAGAPQRTWLEAELAALPGEVRYVLIWLHHPPVADLSTGALADHNPRPNEIALANFLGSIAGSAHARFVVVGGHLHNYERLEQNGVTYLVSGGGGAHPYPVERTPLDRYQGTDFPNFHYVRFRLEDDRLTGEMVRVADPEAAAPRQFEVRDRFEIPAVTASR